MTVGFDPHAKTSTGAAPAVGGHDRALYAILASNLLTLGIAWWQQWGLLHLLWPFWIQSVVIGWYARKRILALEAFSTEGFTLNHGRVDATPDTKRRTAGFFVMHYGFFHLVYLLFLLIFTAMVDGGGFLQVIEEGSAAVSTVHLGKVTGADMLVFTALGLAFGCSHRLSHREHLAADLARRPNIGSLMALPYARVVPMHLCIILGAVLPQGLAVWLFGLLKTAADVLMHKVEHAWLARR